jgi:large subunit ribosomal protein L17
MRHRISGQRLNKSAAHRNSMRRSLMKDVIQYERIQTTEAKARAVRGEIERIITIAKRGRVTGDAVRLVHARRLVISRIGDQALAKKVFDDIAPRYVNRAGGYTRMLKLEARRGDAAKQVLLELVEE